MPQLFGHQYTKQQLLELVGDMTQLQEPVEQNWSRATNGDLIWLRFLTLLVSVFRSCRAVPLMSPPPTIRGCPLAFGAVPAM